MDTHAAPISSKDRIYTLDVIRGFALLGIFIMNMPLFNTSFFAGLDGTEPWPEWWNQGVQLATEVLFSGKFNSMFSMLFAIGFILQLERLEARDPERAVTIYLRRIFWLLVFGVIHACVFWTGDVLHIYALFGLLLLALRRAPEKLLWTLFAACLLYPAAMGIYRLMTFTPELRQQLLEMASSWQASNDAAYGHGSFLIAAREHTREMVHIYTDPLSALRFLAFHVQVFCTMLLGLVLGRRQFFQNSDRYLPQVRLVQWWSLAAGLAAGLIFGIWQATVTDRISPTPFRVIAGISYTLCRVLIMVFYVATMVRAVHHLRWRQRLVPIALVGRMPLTNYLLQTLIATTLFYGWGLGFWGKVGPALDLVLAITIYFVVQVPVSKWWLARFELGPMEYLWRRLTYGHAMLKRAPVARAPV
jgi:uncharacterized protein